MTRTTGWAALAVLCTAAGAAATSPKATTAVIAVVLLLAAAAVTITCPREVALWAVPLLALVPSFVRIPALSGPDLTPQRAVLAAVAVAAYYAIPSDGRQLPRRFLYAAVAFGFYTIASALLHGEGVHGMNKALSYTVEAALPIFLVFRVVRDRDDIDRLVNRLIAVMTFASLLAIWERVSGHFLFAAHNLFFHAPERGGHLRVQGVFPHPLVLGVAVGLVLPFAVGRIVDGQHRRRYLVAAATMAIALYLTQGRGPLLAAAIGLAVFAAASRGSRRFGIVAILAAGVIALAPFAAGSVAKTIENPTAANGGYTVSYRQALLHQTITWVDDHPFGAGPGQLASLPLYAQIGDQGTSDLTVSVDNAYAHFALELGWPGLILFALMLATVVSETRLLPDGTMRAALLASQASIIVASFTVATFTWAQILLLFWTLVGVAFALRRVSRPA